jgi:serine/threonine protein kinase/Tol biopolymer transport system component
MIGTTLLHYRITDKLGAGGMGEVWLAEDTKLGREVALKVLPDEFAQDPDRMARFEREAKVLASLNHPNIATLYGLESAVPSGTGTGTGSGSGTETGMGGNSKLKTQNSKLPEDAGPCPTTFLAMELVEGEDLSERIKRGPVPVEEAVAIALQIAEALEAAHEQGIVHRDLKPANIKLRPDGTVKVLDFGLAKAWDAETGDSSLSLSPTLTAHATAAGVIIGTAAYMSPEQAAGVAADRRADIWAFGVVLWEMLTGYKLFEGETVSHVLASVLKDEVDLDALPEETPARLRELIERCLRKKPKQRLQAIGDARILLEEYRTDPESFDRPKFAAAPEAVPQPMLKRAVPWAAALVATVAALFLGLLLVGREVPERRVIRFETPPPEGGRFHLAPDNPGPVAVSPDGRMIAYSSRTADGVIQLWVRALHEAAARPLPGTENAQYPFWSPDSRHIGFFAGNKLRVIEAAGGPPLALCDASDGKGATWSNDGVIVFAPSYNSPLHRVAEAGGESTPVTAFDADRKDNSHRHPRFLPDGRHFLYMARSASGSSEGHAVMIGSLDGSQDRVLFRAPTAVEYASGHILFIRERTLMARPFDAGKLEFSGDAFPIAEVVTLLAPGTVVGVFSASQNGVLAYQAGEGQDGSFRLVWRDREGNELGTVGEPGSYDEVHIIPGGELAAVSLEENSAGTGDIWVIDLRRNLFTRFTFDPGYESGLTPTPDGKALFYSAQKSGVYALMNKEIGGSGEGEILLESTTEMYPSSVSPDGEYLAFHKGGDDSSWDIWVLPLSGEAEPYSFIETEFGEAFAMFSPDGRWLAYMSNESGSPEIYVTAFPESGRKWQISTSGGQAARWNSSGSEILYHATDGTLTAVRVEPRDGGLLIGEATPIFNTRLQPSGSHFWALSPDGERVLAMETISDHDAPNLSVVVNWLEAGNGR